MDVEAFQLTAVGRVESPLRALSEAPKQGDEGAPEAWLLFEPDVTPALQGIAVGERVLVITWLDRGDREVLQVHPRDDRSRPLMGVFATRSPDRPNPIGLHAVDVLEIDGPRMRVSGLEAIDGTPVLDVKPVLRANVGER